MDLMLYFRSVIEQDLSPVVICDLNHTIIYMNKSAIDKYKNRGGEKLIGKSLLFCHNEKSRDIINNVLEWFKESKEHNIVYEFRNERENKDVYMVALRDENEKLIGYYEKHEYRNQETSKLYDFCEKKD